MLLPDGSKECNTFIVHNILRVYEQGDVTTKKESIVTRLDLLHITVCNLIVKTDIISSNPLQPSF